MLTVWLQDEWLGPHGKVALRVGVETHVGVEVGDEEHGVDGSGGHAVDGHPSCHC